MLPESVDDQLTQQRRRERVRRGGYLTRRDAEKARDELLAQSREECTTQVWTVARWLRYWWLSPDGPMCNSCHAMDPARHEPCSRCGRRRRVAHRLDDGTGLCGTCHQRPVHTCVLCGVSAIAAKRGPHGPLCSSCYERTGGLDRRCGGCGEIGRIRMRATATTPDLCRRCYQGPIRICATCGRERPTQRVAGGPPMCGMCYPRRLDICARCGELRPITARWPIGGVCRDCYRKARTTPAACGRCGERRVLIAVDTVGAICGPCAGSDRSYLCRSCGGSEELYEDQRCVRCVVADRLRMQFGVDGQPAAELEPLLSALSVTHRPRSVLAWLDRHGRGADALAALARAGQPITHDALDALPARQTNALRHMLVHAGVLPAQWTCAAPCWT
jgi:hypothetical protein